MKISILFSFMPNYGSYFTLGSASYGAKYSYEKRKLIHFVIPPKIKKYYIYEGFLSQICIHLRFTSFNIDEILSF